MIAKSVLDKMRAAALVCTCAAGCTKGKAVMDAIDASAADASSDASGAPPDASALADATFDEAGAIDDDDAIDASIDAPFGTVACPVHGAHPKLPDGGVDMTGVRPVRQGGLGGLASIGGPGTLQRDPCPACGMGGVPHDVSPKGDAQLGMVVVNDANVQSQAQRFAASRRPRVRACYQRALLNDPSIAGTLRITVKISADGATGVVTTQNEGLPQPVVACANAVFHTVEVPDLGGKTVLIPFKLQPQN